MFVVNHTTSRKTLDSIKLGDQISDGAFIRGIVIEIEVFQKNHSTFFYFRIKNGKLLMAIK